MTRFTYPVVIRPDDNNTFLVSFPDFPEAHTFGDTKDEALARAADALATIIDAYIADRREIPEPSTTKGLSVTLPAIMSTKLELYNSMREQHVGKAELGRRLNWHLPQVDRLLDVHHASRLDQLESAFGALGKRLVVTIEDAERNLITDSLRKVGRTRKEANRARSASSRRVSRSK